MNFLIVWPSSTVGSFPTQSFEHLNVTNYKNKVIGNMEKIVRINLHRSCVSKYQPIHPSSWCEWS